MVDPNVTFREVMYNYSEELSFQFLSVLTWEGSLLEFAAFNASSYYWLSLTMSGNGSVAFRHFDVLDCYLTLRNVSVSFDDATFGYVEATAFGSDIEWAGRVLVYHSQFLLYNGSSMSIQGADVTTEGQLAIYPVGGDLSVVDSRFSTPQDGTVLVGSVYRSRVVIEGCTFSGVPLNVRFHDRNASWYMTDNIFEGRRAILTLHRSIDTGDVVMGPDQVLPANGTISGNRFTGEGTLLLFDPELREGILGKNVLGEGARAFVSYHPSVAVSSVDGSVYNLTTMDCFSIYQYGGIYARYSSDWFAYMVDVTDDPLGGTDPGLVDAVIRVQWSYHQDKGVVVGFAKLPLSAQTITIRGPDWELMNDEIRLLEEDFNIEYNWWSG